MADNKEARTWLYNSLRDNGIDPGTEQQFNDAMNNRGNRDWAYNALKGKGVDMGSFDAYERAIMGWDNEPVSSEEWDQQHGTQQTTSTQQSVLPTAGLPGKSFLDSQRSVRPEILDTRQQTAANPQATRPSFAKDSVSVVDDPLMKDTTAAQETTNIGKPVIARDSVQAPKNLERVMRQGAQYKNQEEIFDDYNRYFQSTPEGQQYMDELEKGQRGSFNSALNKLMGTKEGADMDAKYKQMYAEAKTDAERDRVNQLYNEELNQYLQNDSDYQNEMELHSKKYNDALMKANPRMGEELRALQKRQFTDSFDSEVGELESRINSGRTYSKAVGTTNYGSIQYAQRRSDKDQAAQRLIDDARNTYEAAKRGDEDYFTGVLKGLKANTKAEKFLFGVTELADAGALNDVLKKSDSGEQLSADEQNLLDAALLNMTTNAYYADNLSQGYKAGQVTAESLPFMLEFVANPISGSGNALAKGILKYGLKKYGIKLAKNKALRAAEKFGTRLLSEGAVGLGMAGTTSLPRVTSDAYNRLNQTYDITESGAVRMTGEDGKPVDMSFGEAWGKGLASTWAENFSEVAFNSLRGFRFPKKIQGMLNKVGNTDFGKFVKNFYNNPTVSEWREATQWHGVFEEDLEEVLNNAISVGLGDMSFDELKDLDKNIETFLGLLPTSIMFGAVGGMGMVRQNRQFRRALDDLYSASTPEEKQAIKDILSIPQTKDQIKSIVAMDAPQEMKRKLIQAVADNARAELTERGAEELTPEQLDQQTQEADMAETEEQAQQLTPDNYIEARKELSRAQRGFDQQRIASAQERLAQFDQSVQEAVDADFQELGNQETGRFEKAKIGDQEVNITGGRIELDDEGNVDPSRSSEVIYYKGEDGKVMEANPSEFAEPTFVPMEEYFNRKRSEMYGEFNDIPQPQQGQILHLDGTNYAIQSVDPDGMVIAQLDENGEMVEGGITKMPLEDYYSRMEQQEWGEQPSQPSQELTEGASQAEAQEPTQPEETQTAETPATEVPSAPATPVTEETTATPEAQAPATPAVNIPRDKDGDIDFANINDPETFKAGLEAYSNEEGEDFDEVLEDYISDAQTAVDKAGKIADPAKRRKAVKAAKARLDMLNGIKSERTAPAEPVSQEATSVPESTESVPETPVSVPESAESVPNEPESVPEPVAEETESAPETADVEPSSNEDVNAAREEVNTEPSDAQKEAGNYKKGHVTIDGLNISIENPKGSTRSGKDQDGNEWSNTMSNDYGYIRRTEGADGDHVDVFLSDNPDEGKVYVIDQNVGGKFDEHKVMYGFNSEQEARDAYLSNYEEGWNGIGAVTEMSKDEFKDWLKNGDQTKPASEYKMADSTMQEYSGLEDGSNTQEMQQRMQDWLNDPEIDWAEARELKEIADKFGNKLEPIAYIPSDWMGSVFGGMVKDNRIYSGKGYFIDHAVNHHPEINKEDYNLIQEVLNNPDHVKDLDNGSIAFTKLMDKGYAVVIRMYNENGKIVMHKSFFWNESNEPYKNKKDIEKKPSVGGSSTISHTEVPGSPLSARDDSESKSKEETPNTQENKEKTSENNTEEDSEAVDNAEPEKTETQKAAEAVASKLGLKVKWVDGLIDGIADGKIEGDTITIQRDAARPIDTIIGHEFAHRMKDKAPKDFKAFQDFIKKNFYDAFMSYRYDYEQRAEMSGVELTDEELDEEATCDFAGFMFHDTNILSEFKKADKSILQQIIDFIDSVIDAIAGNPFVNTGDYSKAREMLVDTIKNAEKNVAKEAKAQNSDNQKKESSRKNPVQSKPGKVKLDTNGGIFVILENGYKLDVNKIDLDSLMWAIYDLGSPKDVANLLSKMFEDKSKKAYKLLQELAKGNYVQGGTNPKEFDTKYASEIIKYSERTLADKGYDNFVKPIIDKLGDNEANQKVIETAAAWPHVDYTGKNGAIYTSRAEKELATFLLFTQDIDKAYDFFRGNMLTEIGGKAWYMLAMKNGLRGIKEDLGIDKNKFKEYAESLLEGAKSSVEDNGKLTYKMTEAAGQDPLRPILSGIFHSNGYAVATNKHLLFRSRKEYNPENEGKVVDKDGKEIDGKYPNVSAIIPDVEAEKNKKLITDVDFGLMHRAAKAALRFNSGMKSVTFILPDGSRVTYNAELLEKFTRALLANGVEGRMIVSPTQANYAWSEDFDALMMPLHAEVGGLVVDMETGKAKFEDFDTGFKSDNVFVGAKDSEPAKRESPSRKVSAEKSAPKEEKSEPREEKSTPSKDSAKDQKEKINDVGEKIAGARKDILREIAKNIAEIDVKSLVEHPFAKVYKKPNLAKAVSEGLMREQDARFYEAYFSTYVNTQKPRTDSRDERYKRYYGSSYETKVDKWAKQTHKSLSFLKDFIEAEDAEKDRIIKEILSDKFLDEAADMAQLEKMKSWNKDTPTRKYTWGELWTPNPMYVTYQILDKLDYKVGDKLDIPFGIIQPNSSFTGYKLVNQKGNANYGDASLTLEDAIDHAVYLAKLKMGYDNLQHPASDFTVNVTKWNKEETGKYEVSYLTSKSGFSVSTREFDNKEAADEFAKAKSGIVKPVMKATSPAEVEILFRNELTGVRTPLSDKKFQSREDASAYIDENYDELNDAANKTIEKESGNKGKKEVTAKDVVRVYYTYETNYVNGKPEYNSGYTVEIPAEYAFNGGYPRKIAGPFKDKAEATKLADSIRDDVLKTYKEAVAEKRAFVYFSEGSNERLGEDYRSGKDVTADDFMNAFGFRGVQFGNWTDQEDRQMAVNQAYDAFMDLAKLLGVSPEALSLNGELGIAFGSRGSGNANAHYERDNVVINLTKTRGAGSLAHEWFHALDNYLSRSAGDKFGMVTDKDVRIREELRNAFDAMLREVRGTNFFERSKKMGDYWGRMHEVTARLFAEWVNNELKKSGMRNDFLSRGVDIDRFTRMSYKWYTHTIKKAGYEPVPYEDWINLDMAYSGFPYPNRKELDSLSPLVKGIFDVIEEREDNGKKALYSLAGKSSGYTLKVPKDEYAKISSTIFTYPNKVERAHVFTANNYYLCDNIDEENGTFDVLATLPIDGNEDYINKRRKSTGLSIIPIKDGENVYDYASEVRSRGGRVSRNVLADARRSGRNGRNVSVDVRQSPNSSRDSESAGELHKGEERSTEEGIEQNKRYSLVGALGLSRLDTPVAGQILNDLEVAKTLDKTGATAKEIHLTTSWSKGADGKWRFEAPDMDFDKEAFDSKKELTPYRLTDIIESKNALKEYEKMYPRLSDTEVVFARKEDMGNNYGSYSHSNNTILLRNDLDIWDSASVLAHELQHLIQHEEGFASGGSLFSAVSNDVLELSDKLGEAIMKRNSGDASSEYVERIREQLNNARNNAYNRLSGEVEARNVGERYFHDEKWKKDHTPEETEDTPRDLQIIQSLPESLSVTKYSLVGDKKTLDWFNKAPKIETYKGMVLMPDGSLASPMADTLNKPGDKKNTLVKSDRLKVGDLHKSDEHPDIVVKIAKGNDGVDYGHVQINKPDGDPTGVAYNPYDHTSDWMLNDQFEGAWMRDDMVVVKFEVTPEEWKKDKPYRAMFAKDPVGPAEWKKGVVGRTISGPNARKVYLTQYSRPVGIASMDEFVSNVREKVGKETPIPFNVVNSAQREALYNAGFNISEPTNSGSGNASRSQYDEWKQSHPDRIPTFEAARETGETIGTKVKMSIASPYGDNVKAWSKDGEIFVNPLNVSNENDATRLVLTEAVADKKLSGLLGKSYEDAINDIWKALPDDVILSIFNAGNGVYDGVMDYMANIAEGDKRPAYWNAVKSALNSAFAKEGIDVSLSDNDARYLFWRSQLTGTPFEITVKDTAMRLKLGIDENPEDDGPGGGRYSLQDNEWSEEMKSIKDEAVKNGTFMKAPNGNPTNLSERQWLQVRTKAFKNWFGNWLGREFLLSDRYVSRLTGNEFKKDDTPITEKVSKFFKDNYNNVVTRKGVGTIILDSRSVKDSISHGIGRNKAAAFAAVPDVIISGIEIDSQSNWKGRGYNSVTIAAPILINNEGYVAVVIITKSLNSNRFYLHEVALQKNLQYEGIKTGTEADLHKGDIANVLTNFINTSKIVDENGEPLVVYHGTKAEIESFDDSKVGSNMDFGTMGRGFYFTSDKQNADNYARNAEGVGSPNTMQVFLNIRNVNDVRWNELSGDNEKRSTAFQVKMRSKGYDGLSATAPNAATWYVVFSPNQIKSATDNTGDFSDKNDGIRYSLPSTDSEGGNLTDAQREYFKDSKAVDKDGNLLVLYHGTPYAGFNTFRGGWFTTSKKDADSYGGNYEGALYDPEEKGGSKTLTAGDFKVGYMTFDSQEDADDFKKAHPLAEEAMTIDKLDEAIDNAEWEGDDELAGSLESKREDFKKIAKDYREYGFAHMVDSSWNDLLSNPEAYTLDDFKRAFLAFDSNAFFDDLDDMDSDDERKDALIEAMHYAMDEGDASAESWNGLTFKTRVPRHGSGISKKDLNRRTYKVYANIKNPAILDANGRHSEFESGDIYDAIKEERAKGVHDGVIVNNWRVGRYQQLGTVVVPFGNNKVKLTTNQNPTSTDDIRYSLVGEVGVSRLKKDGKPIKSQLDIAKQLEAEGKTSEEIFDETGWEKGADGKWRFDIPDLKLDFDKIDKLGDDGRASLGDVIKNKKTWSTYKRMYPGLEDYSIHFMSDNETTTKGYADVEDQIIMINKAKMESPEYMNGVLVHEIQHVIQVDEGFALGGTPEDLPYDQGIYDLMMEAHRANMKYNQAPEGSEEKKLLEKERDELDDRYNKATYDMYRRLAGEVDARNAQERTKYEFGLRRYMPISSTEDTPRDKQIVWGTRDARYSLAQPSDALNLYNQEVMKKSFLNREAWQDSMLGLKVLQDAVEKATGKPIKDFENAYMAENSMSSRNLVEMNYFKNHEFKAILDAVKASGFDITDKDQLKAFNGYIMAKHGIERNRYMSVRKAINSDENLSDEDKEAKMAGYRTAIDLIRQKNLPWEQAQKEMDAVAESFGGILGEDFSGLTSVLGIEMENPDGSNKSKDDIRKEIYDGAYDLVNASEQSHKTDDLWKAINAATGKTLQTINDGGLISNDSLDFIKGMYDYYIPLKGWEEETAMDMYQYLGEQYGNGNLLKKAEGRISVADDPLATIGNNGLVAISRKNRNLMKQKFLFMVLNHPSNLVKTNRPWAMKDLNDNWVVVGPTFADDATPEEIKEAVDDFEEDMKKRAKAEPDKYKRIAQGTKLPVKIDDRSLRQHQVLVYQNGVPYVMTVTGSPRAAQALNGATNPDVGPKWLQGVTDLTRKLASLNTALNPDFVLSNLFRDMGYTHSMLAVKEGSDYAKKYSSNWRGLTLSVNGKLSALKMAGLIKRYENDNLDMSNEDDRLFNEFMKGGGETGYTFVNSIEDYKKIIQDTLKGEKNVLVKAKEAVGSSLETFSRWAEDIARFAAYKTSRQMGRSVERSIWDAKEVSVNFNKKGAGNKFTEGLKKKEFSYWSGAAAQYGRVALMFMNAGVQGLNNMITVARKSPKKFTAIMAAHALVGALIPLANMLIRSLTGGDDDDYWNQPEYTRQSNITLAIPGTDKYLAIPLAIEMRVFYGLGEMFMDMYKNPKDKTPTQWAWRLAEISAGLLPFDVTGEGGIGKNLAPSIARPILDVNANENWMGLPINRTSFQDYTPKFKLASSYTDKTLISVSKMLNKAIGGSDYTDSGTILDQFNDPAAAQYLFEQYFGGLGQSIGRIMKDMGAAMSGKIGELKPRDLIILNRFVKDASQEQKDKRINTIWFNEKDKMERVNANANGLIRDIKETSDENERARLINELNIIKESPEFAGLKVWKEYNSALNKVSNSDLDDDTKNDLKYAIKKEMVGLVKGDEELVSEGKSELEEIKANRQKIEN